MRRGAPLRRGGPGMRLWAVLLLHPAAGLPPLPTPEALWGRSWAAALDPLRGACRRIAANDGTVLEWCHADALRRYAAGGASATVLGRFDPDQSAAPLRQVFTGGDRCGDSDRAASAVVHLRCCEGSPEAAAARQQQQEEEEDAVDDGAGDEDEDEDEDGAEGTRGVEGLDGVIYAAVQRWAAARGEDGGPALENATAAAAAAAAASAAAAVAEAASSRAPPPAADPSRPAAWPRPDPEAEAAARIHSVATADGCSWEAEVCAAAACEGRRPPPRRAHQPSHEEVLQLREEAREMFGRAYDAYMAHAFPDGELRPLSCSGHPFSQAAVPALGLVDALSTLAVMGNGTEFHRGVGLVLDTLTDFSLDINVSVFETSIRVLGGLLSAHVLCGAALRLGLGPAPRGTCGALLRLAHDLGGRLLGAFAAALQNSTGLPYGTINLRHGVPEGETPVASTAGAGSLTIEFGVLSVLTGDPCFAAAARGAAQSLHALRSPATGLVGKHVDARTGQWTELASGIGTNADSYFEYMLKAELLFGDGAAWQAFSDSYDAVLAHQAQGDWYADVDMNSGMIQARHVEGLQAFWPGMQTLMGDVGHATHTLNAMMGVWLREGALPEQYDYAARRLGPAELQRQYILRPELIESLAYARRATGDGSWLWAGRDVLLGLQRANRARCGYASVHDLATGAQRDSMPSFFLSETAKYLYLLFADAAEPEGHWALGSGGEWGGWVFSTEAHPFPVALCRDRLPRADPPRGAPVPRRVCAAPAADGEWAASYDPSYVPDDGPSAAAGAAAGHAQQLRQQQLKQLLQQTFGAGSA
eukprot:TRINITY_DN4408_c0_g1_i1.p1 TRINITY_DN4408_c0_g1~~TRINITY_DN4408_c0_g1_i1.p1  ORF type:complete len:816 (+),score=273.26 TRINITY_DN4408_c0_g1_i1:84-2531(+)